MADEKKAEPRKQDEEAAEGQPTTDPTIHYADVEASAVGQPTEPPRPDPTAEIRQRYEDNASGEGPDSPEELAEKRVETRKAYVEEREKGQEEFDKAQA